MAKIKSSGSKSGTPISLNFKDLSHIEKVLEMMSRHQVTEFELEKGGERLYLSTRKSAIVQEHVMPSAMAAASAPVAATQSSQSAAGAANSNLKQVVSPFVGTFYRAASPTADPYVREGQTIKRGDTLCIIEAMKLMNEIEAEFGGKIVSVLVENGQPVEFGEPLFMVDPSQ